MSKKANTVRAIGGFHDGGTFWYRFFSPYSANYDESDDEQGNCPPRRSDGALPVLALVEEDGLWVGPPGQVLGEHGEDPGQNCAVAFDAEGARRLLKRARPGEKLIILNGSVVHELLSARRDKRRAA
jgi:hypothetical protein